MLDAKCHRCVYDYYTAIFLDLLIVFFVLLVIQELPTEEIIEEIEGLNKQMKQASAEFTDEMRSKVKKFREDSLSALAIVESNQGMLIREGEPNLEPLETAYETGAVVWILVSIFSFHFLLKVIQFVWPCICFSPRNNILLNC